LRVDVDGPRPTQRVSADYFRGHGATRVYIGSMRVDRIAVTTRRDRVTVTGNARFSWPSNNDRITVTIPRAAADAPPPPATLRHAAGGGAQASAYVCDFESPRFRTVLLEESYEPSVARFMSYDTGTLPSGGPQRVLSIASAYAEAGIEMQSDRAPTEVDVAIAGADTAWSDAELHAAMEQTFSRWADRPQWAIWLLHAVVHEDPEIFGLMFDRIGLQRQGCAVFYGGLRPTEPSLGREFLLACVHELGHGFNLPHCWQRSLAEPDMPTRPAARSWMNYPRRFPGGAQAFWSRFAFAFDDPELVHLRHGFRDSAIMGGEPFAAPSGPDRAASWDAAPQDAGLRLALRAPARLAQGMPAVLALELSATRPGARQPLRALDPRTGTVDIAIRDPHGREFVFEPLLRHCRSQDFAPLRTGAAPNREYVFVHYGRRGFAFADPGDYTIRARYAAGDGLAALSDEATVRVTAPASRSERAVLDLVEGDASVGALLSLVGSDGVGLLAANAKLEAIVAGHPAHPLAAIARVAIATNLTRSFKRLASDGSVSVRPADLRAAAALLAPVIDLRQVRPSERITVTTGLDPAVFAYVNSRRTEIGQAVARLQTTISSEIPRGFRRRATTPTPAPEVTSSSASTDSSAPS